MEKTPFPHKAGLCLPLLSCFLLILDVRAAHAVQAHGGREGLVSHLLGHILFTAGAFSILYRIYSKKWQGAGWRAFKTFLWLILFWNLLTFTGHWLAATKEIAFRLGPDGAIEGYYASRFTDYLYYLSRLDHLLLVPAIFFLLVALKKWRYTDST